MAQARGALAAATSEASESMARPSALVPGTTCTVFLWRPDVPNANRDKGLKAERDVAKYFRAAGALGVERSVSTGWDTGTRKLADVGDLKGLPGITVQIKNLAKTLAGKALTDAMAETETQRAASGEPLGLLVEKRAGHASPGEWWAHLPANIHAALIGGYDPHTGPLAEHTYPVRTELCHITDHLVRFSRLCEQGTEAA